MSIPSPVPSTMTCAQLDLFLDGVAGAVGEGEARHAAAAELADLDWRIRRRGVREVLAELKVQAAAAELLNEDAGRAEAWHEFIRSEAHVLATRPDLLLQQALNAPPDSVPATAALGYSSARVPWPIRWLDRPRPILPTPLRSIIDLGRQGWSLQLLPGEAQALVAVPNRVLKVDLETGTVVGRTDRDKIFPWGVAHTAGGDVAAVSHMDSGAAVYELGQGIMLADAGLPRHANFAVRVSDDRLLIGYSHEPGAWDEHDEDRGWKVRDIDGDSPFGMLALWHYGMGILEELTREPGTQFVAGVVSEDGETAAVGDDRGRLHIWDLPSGEPRAVVDAIPGEVTGVALTPDGQRAVVVGEAAWARCFDLPTLTCVGELGDLSCTPSSVSISGDGARAVLGAGYGELLFWDLESGAASEIPGHPGSGPFVAISRDGHTAVSTSDDETVRVWDVATAFEVGRPPAARPMAQAAARSPPTACRCVPSPSPLTIASWSREATMAPSPSGTG